jgi:hypothetical protein
MQKQRKPHVLLREGMCVCVKNRIIIIIMQKKKKRKLGYTFTGTLVNTNTIEEFRTIDKNQLFQQLTEKVIEPRKCISL